MAISSVSVMANSLRLRSAAARIARASGNTYGTPTQGFVAANRAPLLAMAAAVVVLVAPLVTFTIIDRNAGDDRTHSGHSTSAAISEREIRVSLTNWAVEPSPSTISSGRVTFTVVHDEAHAHGSPGAASLGEVHNLVILRKQADGSFESVARTRNIPAGTSEQMSLTLQPGEYVLECDVVEESSGQVISHYQQGMHVAFIVT